MTPTSFEFRLTLPGDARLVDTVRGLTAHAAGYARLGDSAREGLASLVASATRAAIAAIPGAGGPVDLCYTGDEEALTVVISCAATPAVPRPTSTSADVGTADWVTEGSRHVCHIRQPLQG